MKFFASDNNSGTHPLVLQAMGNVNAGYAKAYGQDPWTEEAIAALRSTFGNNTKPWFVFIGTAANVLGLKSMVQSCESIICTDTAHIHVDECGAPEALIGSKLLPVPSLNGKICLESCKDLLLGKGDVHHPFPRVLSITQLTECGTLYTLDELAEIGSFCRANDLYFHMDGARLCNAAVALNCTLKELTADVGVDVLSFGGTKNGLMFGEAVVFFNDKLGGNFPYFRKQNMQLGSKMRYVAAQFIAYMQNELWRRNAEHSNSMAALLAASIADLPGVRLAHPVEGNMIFAWLRDDMIAKLESSFYFYTMGKRKGDNAPEGCQLARFLTSFDTTETDILEFANAIRQAG